MQRRAIALFTPTIQDMMDIAKMADDAGFDSVWNGEFFNRNGLVTLAAVALSTKRAKIATGIAYAYMRNPVLNATGAMDLDERLARSRAALVKCPCQEFLPGAALAPQQDGRGASGDAPDKLQ